MIVNVSLIIQGGVKINFIFLLLLPSTLLIHLCIAGLSYSPIWFSSILLLTIIVNFASTIQPNTQSNTWRHGRVGQPGPWYTLLTHVKKLHFTIILRTCYSQKRKPEKTNCWKNRDRVTQMYAMASSLGL